MGVLGRRREMSGGQKLEQRWRDQRQSLLFQIRWLLHARVRYAKGGVVLAIYRVSGHVCVLWVVQRCRLLMEMER